MNLSAHSTQRNEGYHVVVKEKLHKHTPLSKAIQTIVGQTKQLGHEYNARINCNQKSRPRLLDKAAFAEVGYKLTHYASKLVMLEWSATKLIADHIEEGKEPRIDTQIGCQFKCQLPLRYCLPCKHWIYKAFVEGLPIPLSLFHPRWLLDGPDVLYER